MLGQVRGDRRLEIQDKAFVVGHGPRLRIIARIELVIGVLKALARVGAGHQIGMRVRRLDLVDLDLPADVVRVLLLAGQPVIDLPGG